MPEPLIGSVPAVRKEVKGDYFSPTSIIQVDTCVLKHG